MVLGIGEVARGSVMQNSRENPEGKGLQQPLSGSGKQGREDLESCVAGSC